MVYLTRISPYGTIIEPITICTINKPHNISLVLYFEATYAFGVMSSWQDPKHTVVQLHQIRISLYCIVFIIIQNI